MKIKYLFYIIIMNLHKNLIKRKVQALNDTKKK
jgi:hypothetical protein